MQCYKSTPKNVKANWHIERRKYYEKNGYNVEDKNQREEDENILTLITNRDRGIEKKKIQYKIKDSYYNKYYKGI